MVLSCMDPRFQPVVYDYLKKRKIDNSIIKEFKIGFVNFNSSIYEKLNKNYDVKILNSDLNSCIEHLLESKSAALEHFIPVSAACFAQ